MGVSLKEIIERREISVEELGGKVLAVDAYNNLYQYLTTIRSRDGRPLTDSKGNITSHLMGLFSRSTSLMQKGISLIFVFDGTPPALKWGEQEKRRRRKEEAEQLYSAAEKKGDTEAMRKYSSRFVRLLPEMIDESKKLVSLLGLPAVQAPSEGEAQIAHMVKQGDAFACVSQDYDSLIHGATRLVRNLSISGRKKRAGTLSYETIRPEMILLDENLKRLEISQDQLIALAMIVGTDYNPGGIKGIGPKNALKLVKRFGTDFDALFKEVEWAEHAEVNWEEVFNVIKRMPVTDSYSLKWAQVDVEGIVALLCGRHNFSEQRVMKSISDLEKERVGKSQKGLGDFA